MRIALVTPLAPPAVGGNAVTVGRLAQGLWERGVAATALDLSCTPSARVDARLAELAPDLVHAFHGYHGAQAALPFVQARSVPLVVTLTGTDVNLHLDDPKHRTAIVAAVRAADAVVAFHESIAARVIREVPEAQARLVVIPQSVRLGGVEQALVDRVSARPGEVRFLLPAGIRRVKNVLFPLAPLAALARRYPLRLFFAGPVLEEGEGARLAAALEGVEWATHVGEVPHHQMASLLAAVDVVLNCSRSEGGMANAVLEAMSCGKPVLGSDIEGNRSLIEPEVDGLLYADAESFAAHAERLIRDPALRARLGAAARAKVTRLYPPDREIDAHLALYRRVLGR